LSGLLLGAAFVLSACGRASAGFCVPLDGRAAGGVLGAGGVGTEAAVAAGTVTVGPAGASVLNVATGGGSAFEAAAASSGFSGRRAGAGATGEGAAGLPGPLAGPISVVRTVGPRFCEALAGMIGGGIVARGCARRGSG
jgi:hypothetical protein